MEPEKNIQDVHGFLPSKSRHLAFGSAGFIVLGPSPVPGLSYAVRELETMMTRSCTVYLVVDKGDEKT